MLKVILAHRFQRSEDHGVDDYAVVAAVLKTAAKAAMRRLENAAKVALDGQRAVLQRLQIRWWKVRCKLSPHQQKSAGVKSFVPITQGLKPYMGQ